MTSPRRSAPAPVRSTRQLVLGIVCVVVVLCGVACSDAHTQAELNLADNGSNPSDITLLAPSDATIWLHALTNAYVVEHPELSFVYESQVSILPATGKAAPRVTAVPEKLIASGAAPEVWIDNVLILRKYAKDPRAQAPPFRIGDDLLELDVQVGNPQQVTGYEVFGPGPYPRTGLCIVGTPCGIQARRELLSLHIEIKPDSNYKDGPTLAIGIAQGQVAAGLLLGSDAAAQRASLTTLATSRPIAYGAMGMQSDPAAAAFLKWLQTSPEVPGIIAASGLHPPAGTH